MHSEFCFLDNSLEMIAAAVKKSWKFVFCASCSTQLSINQCLYAFTPLYLDTGTALLMASQNEQCEQKHLDLDDKLDVYATNEPIHYSTTGRRC